MTIMYTLDCLSQVFTYTHTDCIVGLQFSHFQKCKILIIFSASLTMYFYLTINQSSLLQSNHLSSTDCQIKAGFIFSFIVASKDQTCHAAKNGQCFCLLGLLIWRDVVRTEKRNYYAIMQACKDQQNRTNKGF